MADQKRKQKIVFMFSGQGSQYFHMGREQFETNPSFREKLIRLDSVYQAAAGRSVIAYLYRDDRSKSDPFVELSYSHPAIFMVELALAHAVMERGIYPDAVLGASLGEYAAAAVAGVLEPEETLCCLADQAKQLQKMGAPGGMTAVLCAPHLFHETPLLQQHAEWVTAYGESYFVIAGTDKGLEMAESCLRTRDVPFLRLPVTIPFHTSHMDGARSAVRSRLDQLAIGKAGPPLYYSAVSGSLRTDFSSEYFWEVIRKPIQFEQAVCRAVDDLGETLLLDLGPSGTLANFARTRFRSLRHVQISSLLSPYTDNQKSWNALLASTAAPS